MKKYIPIIMILVVALFIGTSLGFLIAHYSADTTIILAKHWVNNENATETVLSGSLGKININTASLSQLCLLPGIGETTAKKIISYRENTAVFKRIEDIMKIEGIGNSKFQNIKEYITVTNGG